MRSFASAITLSAGLAVDLAGCAAPVRETPPLLDLRVCVESEATAELYRRHFKTAVAAEPREGRECDAVVRAENLNAGKITVTSAYDGKVLAIVEGTLDLAPQLVKLSLGQGTEAYRRLWAQRKASGFGR